jgi:hypothetical protein
LQQQQQENVTVTTSNNNKPTTSLTLTEAEKKARNAQYNRKYRKQCKEQQHLLSQQSITLNATIKPTTIQEQEINVTAANQENKDLNAVTQECNLKCHYNNNATEDENEGTAINYTYSDATLDLMSRLVVEANTDPSRMCGDMALHGIMASAYVRDDRSYRTRWTIADSKFNDFFSSNEFGAACSVCDRLWFASDVRSVLPKHFMTLQSYFRDEDVQRFVVCSNCYRYLESGRMAPMSRWYGFDIRLNRRISHL